MSRSGYIEYDGEEQWSLIRWRGAVTAAIRGKRGQAFFRELADALDAMPVKALIANELETADGAHCALGVLGKKRGLDMATIDPEERDQVARAFGIAEALAAEVVYENDEVCSRETPEQRWTRMRQWVENCLGSEERRRRRYAAWAIAYACGRRPDGANANG